MNDFPICKDSVNECCIAIDFSSDPPVCPGTIQTMFSWAVERRAQLIAVIECCAAALQIGFNDSSIIFWTLLFGPCRNWNVMASKNWKTGSGSKYLLFVCIHIHTVCVFTAKQDILLPLTTRVLGSDVKTNITSRPSANQSSVYIWLLPFTHPSSLWYLQKHRRKW